jgi:hypothetical protein
MYYGMIFRWFGLFYTPLRISMCSVESAAGTSGGCHGDLGFLPAVVGRRQIVSRTEGSPDHERRVNEDPACESDNIQHAVGSKYEFKFKCGDRTRTRRCDMTVVPNKRSIT